MHVQRLERLITVIKGVERAKLAFDLGHWAVMGPLCPTNEAPCGTSACACGYGALDAVLQAEGLHMKVWDNDETRVVVSGIDHFNQIIKQAVDDVRHIYTSDFGICYGDEEGWRAIEAFFELSVQEAQHLFADHAYPLDDRQSPRAVIERIEAMLAGDQAEA